MELGSSVDILESQSFFRPTTPTSTDEGGLFILFLCCVFCLFVAFSHSKERKWWRKERLAREQNRTIQRRARASGDQDEEMDGFDRPLSDDSDDSSLDGDRSEDEDEDSGSSDGEGSEEGIGRFVDEEAVSSDDEEGDSSDRGFLDDEDEEPVPRKPRLRSAASRAETEDEDDEVLVMSEDETNRSPVRIGRKLKKRVVVSDAEEEEEEE